MSFDYENDSLTKLFQKISEKKYAPSSNPPSPSKLREAQVLRTHELENNAKESTSFLRKAMCYWVMGLVTVYLGIVAWIVLHIANLSDSVLIAILTTTTINVLGLPLMIILSLFPKEKEEKKSKDLFRANQR